MTIDLSKAPYNDRFDEDKEYTKVLYQPDRALQAAELNEQQSIVDSNMIKLGNAIFTDGDVQEGMAFLVNPEKTEITVREGLVYLGGKVRKFKEQTIPFVAVGDFNVQIKLKQEIVTFEKDANLLDQSLGSPNYLSEGADRLKETVELTSGDSTAVTLYQFVDGSLFKAITSPSASKLGEVLAQRTFDESGSYKVEGLELYLEKHPTDESKVNLVIDAGKAYVLGYQILKTATTKIAIPKAMGTRQTFGEAFYYSPTTRRGKLGSSPVKSVDRVNGQIQVTKELVNRGSVANSSDSLKNSSVFKIDRLWQENEGEVVSEYTQGVDYQLLNGNSISWALNGSEPSSGSTYFVTYKYNRVLQEGRDYKVVTEGGGDYFDTYIDFAGMSGVIPIADSLVTVDYTYYLAREDLVIMDKDGNITVKYGQSDSYNKTTPPQHSDPYTLILGGVKLIPNSDNGVTANSDWTSLSMIDLRKLKRRLENVEHNQALNYLDQPAMAGINPTTLRGVFSDGFISTEKSDITHPDHTIAYSFDDAEITLPYASVNTTRPVLLESQSNCNVWGRLVTAPFNEVEGIAQLSATSTMNVNPYNVYNATGILKLNPSEDNWVEEDETIIYEDGEPKNVKLRRWWISRNPQNSSLFRPDWEFSQNVELDEGQSWSGGIGGELTGTISTTTASKTTESAIEYIRERDVNFTVTNLIPGSDNLEMTFDGREVKLTPTGSTQAGGKTGTLKADSNGKVTGSFRIPKGVRCGVREVALYNNSNDARATYVAQGIRRTEESVIRRQRVTMALYDPLAQTFQFPTNKVVTSIELFFASRDTSKNIGVQIRNVTESGMPGKTIYAETTLTPSQIAISSTGYAPTKVVFDDPLICDAGKEYAIVIMTDSDKYSMYIATLGETDIQTKQTIVRNPYLQGILFSSSNASAWTPHQGSDLKFKVNVAKFNKKAELKFNPIKDISANSVMLLATYLTPENTGAFFEARMVLQSEASTVKLDSKQWLPITDYVDMDLGDNARELELRCTFEANENMSPLLSLHDITLATFLSDLKGSYVSRTINMEEAPFNTIKFQIEVFEPASTTVIPRYSLDGGSSWNKFTVEPVSKDLGDGYVDLTWEEQIHKDNQLENSIKYRLDMETINTFQRPRARKLRSVVTER